MKKGKAKVLMVDDDEAICRVMSLILEGEGFEVETAFTGKDAIKKSRSRVYDAAILDFRLPDMEGTKVLKEMSEISPKMVKIMLTGYPSVQNAVDSLNFGADAYLVKPPNPEEVINSIREKLQKREEEALATEERISVFLKTRTAKLLQEGAE